VLNIRAGCCWRTNSQLSKSVKRVKLPSPNRKKYKPGLKAYNHIIVFGDRKHMLRMICSQHGYCQLPHAWSGISSNDLYMLFTISENKFMLCIFVGCETATNSMLQKGIRFPYWCFKYDMQVQGLFRFEVTICTLKKKCPDT